MRVRTERDLAEAVKRTRLEMGATQGTLAQSAGLTRKWIGHIETGHLPGEFRKLLRLLDALDLEVDLVEARVRKEPSALDALFDKIKP